MGVFKKGAMRKEWVAGKEAAKKKCVNKGEENFLALFSKDDFGPKLDKVDDNHAKRETKPADYKKHWDVASNQCNALKTKAQEVGITDMNIDTQKCLLKALNAIRKALDEAKPL